MLHALTSYYTPNSWHAVALQELTMEYSVNQYLLLTVHVTTDMNPGFVAKQNECGVYYSIMCTFQQLVGVHYAEEHRSVIDASLNYSRKHFDLRPLDIFVSWRRPDATLSHMAQNSEPSRCIYNTIFA
jgi:hypothetical protein